LPTTDAPPLVALFGATALGKSDVALELAGLLDAEIVVADSMQIYAGLPIVTNQPGEDARRRAGYHLVGWASPQDECGVARYAALAHEAVDSLLEAGRPVIVEGGSGLYLRAVLGDLAFGGAPDAGRRRALEERWEREPAALVAELRRRAPDVAARVDLRNPRRVIRALESLEGEGTGVQTDELWSAGGRYAHRLLALDPGDDRDALMARIERRVDEMLAAGALEEVAAARAAGPLSRTAAQAIGVRELCAVLDGGLTLPEAAARMKARTRALARRQLTWMRKLPDAARVPASGRPPAAVARDVLSLVRGASW
jgi:tRNA dimethylallyltransferase